MQFVDFSDELGPLLMMEYLALGDLQDQEQIDPVAVLQQGLKALAYLHPRGIVHRDIKPANILIKSIQPFHIKLADLGIAIDNSVLLTYCGIRRYAAPEVWGRGGYTSAVDIWSLAVVVFKCAYGLPERGRKTDSLSWFRKIIRAIEDWDSDSLVDLLSTKMLKMDPQDRVSTSGCLKEALDLDLGILNIPNFEVGDLAPTERISTSLILKIVGIKKKIDDSDNNEEAETLILPTQLSDEHVETSTEFASKATERSRLKASELQHRRSISRRSLASGDDQEEGPVKKKRTLRDLANSADIFYDPLKRCCQENQSEIPPLLASNCIVTLPGQPPRPIHSSSLPADIYDVDNGSTSVLFE